MSRAAIYTRLSRDRDEESTGIARQLEDCRNLARAKGWEIVGEYEERDISAFSGADRPAYEAMLSEVDAGSVDIVLAWKLDRLIRRSKDLENLLERCEKTGAHIATVSDSIDTTSPAVGDLMPRLLTIFANLESKNTALRLKRKHQEIAANGRRSGGGYRPFGLKHDWSAIVSKEAKAIREAVRRLITGETTLYRIAAEWNERGLKTTTGKRWNTQLVRSMIYSPRLAGARLHDGQLVITGAIPAIITADDYRALVARRGPGRAGAQPRYLLSGILRCGVCGSTMVMRRRHKDGKKFYGCEKAPGKDACGHVHIVADPLEALVTEAAVDQLASPEFAAALEQATAEDSSVSLARTLAADEAALEELAHDHYVARIIGRGEYLAAREPLGKRIEAAKKRLKRAGVMVAPDGLADTFEAGTVEDRRKILSDLLEFITISPASRRGAPFEPQRVDYSWRV